MKRWLSSSIRFTALASAFAFAACQDVSITTVPVERLVIEPGSATVQVNGTVLLNATPVSDNGQPLPGRRVSWLSLNEAVATVDETGLVHGVATGTATIRAVSEGASGDAEVVVTIGPALAAAPLQVGFTAAHNGASPGDRTVTVTNAGTGSLTGVTRSVRYASGQPGGWLSAALAGTTAPTTLVLAVNQAGLSPGSYQAFVDLSSTVAPNRVTVAVTLTVTATEPPPAIVLSSASLTFGAAVGGANPAQQQVTINNGGGGSLTSLSAAVEYTSAQTGWLAATLGGSTAPTALTLSATTGALPAGSHTARVLVASPVAGNTPQQVTVTFNVTQASAPGAPGNLTATAVSLTAIDLNWNASSGSVQGYRIERRPAAGGSFVLADSVGAGTTSYRDTGLLAATGYTYRVQACGAGGCSGWSNEASATTLTADVPDVPGNLAATPVSPTQVRLSWTPPGSQTYYDIRRRTGGGGQWNFETTVAGDQAIWLDSGLTPDTNYQYQIRACSPAGCSQYSSQVTARTPGS
jgi:hypothetical protein